MQVKTMDVDHEPPLHGVNATKGSPPVHKQIREKKPIWIEGFACCIRERNTLETSNPLGSIMKALRKRSLPLLHLVSLINGTRG